MITLPYYRKSRNENDKTYRYDESKVILPKFAKSQTPPWKIYKEYDEGITSGTSHANMPRINQIKEDVISIRSSTDEETCLLALDLSRFSRDVNMIDWTNFLAFLAVYRIGLATPTEYRHTWLDSDWQLLIMQGTFSATYMRTVLKSLKEGKDAKRKKGGYIGGVIQFGYRFDKILGKIMIDEGEMKTVLKTIELQEQDYSFKDTVKILKPEKFETRKCNPIDEKVIGRIVSEKSLYRYSGYEMLDDGKLTVSLDFPSVINIETAIKILNLKKRRTTRSFHSKWNKHLFSNLGLLKCGYCGTTVGIARPRPTHVYYFCRDHRYKQENGRGKDYCNKLRYIPQKEFEKAVIDGFLNIFQDVDLIRQAYDLELEQLTKDDRTGKLNKRIQSEERKKERLVKAIALDYITLEDAKKEIDGINARINTLCSEKAELLKSQKTLPSFDTWVPLIQNIRGNFDNMDYDDKRKVMKGLIEKIKVYSDAAVIHLDFPYPEWKVIF